MKLQKETKLHGRWYDDACGTAFALEVIGERWALLIVRELMFGGRRFSDLRAGLPGISAKVLTERLEGLEQAGVLKRVTLPPPAAARLYELTEWGYLAEPLMQELGRWAARSPAHNPTLRLSPVSLMLSLRTMIDPLAAGKLDLTVGFAIGGHRFVGELTNGELAIRRGSPEAADIVIHAPEAPVLAAMFYGNGPVDELERSAGLVIEGDRALARRFVDIFHLPPKTGD